MWNQRMFLLEGDSKFYDVLERTLYNGLLSGISLSADRFFYPNPLESHGQHTRSAWFGCACCPSNICRFIPSVPGYVYAKKGNDLYVNLFMNNSATVDLNGERINLEQTTDYPWNGKIAIGIYPVKKKIFSMMIRIPGWANNKVVPSDLYHFKYVNQSAILIKVNGKNFKYDLKNGYAVISREWNKGDQLTIDFPMPVREIIANESVKDDNGKVALQRGPVVYCAEWPDNKKGHVLNLSLNSINRYSTEFLPGLLNGVTVIKTVVNSSSQPDNKKIDEAKIPFTAIPYYAWANRGAGEMMVWIPQRND
jgi:hypothetical protein